MHVFLQVGRQNLWVQKRYEQYDTIRSKLTLDLAQEYGEEMQAGVYEFAWSFIVPANAAVSKAAIDVRSRSLMPLLCFFQPYERSDFGRSYHKVHATAYGAGRRGADLTSVSDEIGLGESTMFQILAATDRRYQLQMPMTQVKLQKASPQRQKQRTKCLVR